MRVENAFFGVPFAHYVRVRGLVGRGRRFRG